MTNTNSAEIRKRTTISVGIIALSIALLIFAEPPVLAADITQVAGYHDPWPGKVVCLLSKKEKGERIKRKDIQQRSIASADNLAIDALCFPEEAIGATAAHPLVANYPLTLHDFDGAIVKQARSGPKPSSSTNNGNNSGRILIAPRGIAKGKVIAAEDVVEVSIPNGRVPVDAFSSINAIVGYKSSRQIPSHNVIGNSDVEHAGAVW